jgi:hypothetical protein
MILAVILIPALIAMAMLNSMPASRVLTRLYVPCVMFIPVYMTWGIGGFTLNDTTPVLLILCAAGLVRWHNTLRFTFVDLCVLLFAFSAFYADAHLRPVTIGLYVLCQNFATCALPYFVGRTLIEQTNSRREFAKSLVFCLAIVGLTGLYEYRMERNLFNEAVWKLGVQNIMGLQTRWGYARIAGPFGAAILAGMMFTTGLLIQLWLAGTKSWDGAKTLRLLRASRRGKAMTLCVCLGLFLTQSRGPWLGCLFGLMVAAIGFAKDRRRAAILAIGGLTVALIVTAVILSRYTSEKAYSAAGEGDAEQQDAAYRANLIPLYTPLIEQGGLWGWGTPQVHFRGEVGYLAGQTSIDNEFIRVAMAQGYFGAGVFVLILVGSAYRAARLCATFRNRQDFLLAYCLLGTTLALAFTLTTVALLDPMTQISFMIFGWTQSLRPTGNEQEALATSATGPFAFKRVFA